MAVIIVPVMRPAATGVSAPSVEQRAADGLGGAGRGGVALAGLEAELSKNRAVPVEAVAAEPAEQLLRPVTDEQRADDEAKCGSPEVHAASRGRLRLQVHL